MAIAEDPQLTGGRVKRLLSSTCTTQHQSIVTRVEGLVKGLPHVGSRGLVLYLFPWWRRASELPPASPIRIRLPEFECLTDLLTPGASVRIVCQDLERPRRGSPVWTATGRRVDFGRLDAPTELPVVVHDRLLNRVVLERTTNMLIGQRARGQMRYMFRIERSAADVDATAVREDVLRAAGIVRRFERQAGDVRALIAPRVRDLYNARWRNGRRCRSVADVAAALEVSELTIKRDGSISIHMRIDDLFYGHWIEVLLDPGLGMVSLHTAP